MALQKLPSEVSKLLNERLADELQAERMYMGMSVWLANQGFEKAAEWAKNESNDEKGHAQRILDHFTDWNTTPELPVILKSVPKFSGLADMLNEAYNAELSLYNKYEETYSAIEEEYPACAAWLQQFLLIQNDAVAEASTRLNIIEGVTDKASLLLIQKQLF